MFVGSGKTTLLNFLSAKMFSRNLQLLQGEVYLNGVRRQDVDSSRFTAYVQQDDVLFETMTVRGTYFSFLFTRVSYICCQIKDGWKQARKREES